MRGCSAISARAARPTGTFACSTGSSTSRRSACTRAARAASRSPARLAEDLGKPVLATADWRSCVEGADIVVEASRLSEPQPLLETRWIAPGALVVPYGTMSAVELSLTEIMDKVVVDDWGQCATGQFGSLRAHVETGRLTRTTLHAELCEIVVGARPGREAAGETILFWHRGLSLSDIALAHALLEQAAAAGIGQRLRFAVSGRVHERSRPRHRDLLEQELRRRRDRDRDERADDAEQRAAEHGRDDRHQARDR